MSVGLDRVSHGKEPWLVYNPDPAFYQGMIPIRNWVTRSMDGGRTWARPWLMEGLTVRNSSAQTLVTTASGTARDRTASFRPGLGLEYEWALALVVYQHRPGAVDVNGDPWLTSSAGRSPRKHFPQGQPLGFRFS